LFQTPLPDATLCRNNSEVPLVSFPGTEALPIVFEYPVLLVADTPKIPPDAIVSVSPVELKFTFEFVVLLIVSELIVVPPNGTMSVAATARLLLLVEVANVFVIIAPDSIRIPPPDSYVANP
jgi:hypothetical protein